MVCSVVLICSLSLLMSLLFECESSVFFQTNL